MLGFHRLDDRLRRHASPRPLVVLAIDDEERRATYAFALSATGFDVAAADDLDRWPAPRHDGRAVIGVVDVSPDSRFGWTLVQKLRRDRGTRDVPVVAIAPDAGAAIQARARHERCAAVCVNTCPAPTLAFGLRAVLDQAGRSPNS
jgi:CheY-like chemotaxis protein